MQGTASPSPADEAPFELLHARYADDSDAESSEYLNSTDMSLLQREHVVQGTFPAEGRMQGECMHMYHHFDCGRFVRSLSERCS